MGAMDNWDVTLLIVAGYLAVVALVRLMVRHRDQILDEVRRQFENEKQRKKKESDDDEKDEWQKSA
jgi:hypothetical protein